MKKTLAIVLALMMLVLALPVGAAGTGGDNDIPFNDLIGKTDPVVESIAVTTLPTKLTYQIGDALDVTGGKVTLTYDDAHTEEIDLTAEMVTGFDSAAAGKKALTVTYGEFTATFAVTVEEPVVLSGIAVTTLPKQTYQPGEALDVTGGKITLTYSDNTTTEIDMTADMVTGFDSTTGPKTLTVTYEGKTATYKVMVGAYKINAATLVLQSSLTMLWKTDSAMYVDGGYENPYFVFQFYDENGDCEERTVTDYTVDGNRYVFEFTGVGANRMADKIVGNLYATFDGKEYAAAPIEYSVLAYANSQLSKATDDKLKTILVDMLNYGAAAQVYNKYNLDNLANAGLTEAQKAYASTDVSVTASDKITDTNYVVVENAATTWKSAALTLGSSVVINAKFADMDLDGVTVKVTAGTKEMEITDFTFEANDKGDRWVADFAGLAANQMRTPAYFTVYKDGVAISNTLRYSIASYAYGKTTPGSDLNNLVIAMMKFGDAVAAKYPPAQ